MSESEFHEMISELDARTKARVLSPQLPLTKLSKYVSERLVAGPSEAIPECSCCGLCCSYPLIVPVSREESELLSEYIDVTVDDVEPEAVIDRVLPRDRETGSCIYLEGTLGNSVRCGNYDKRPHTCRDFDAGSDRCHEYRRMYGLERQLTKQEVNAAVEKLDKRAESSTIKFVSIVPDSTISHLRITCDGVDHYETTMLKIVAFLDENDTHDLHRYDAKKEVWFGSELVGYSLDEAREIIRSRTDLQF